jgi:hypothetical protein
VAYRGDLSRVAFTAILSELVEEHADVVPILAKGIAECSRYMSLAEVTHFLSRTIKARIGIRVIAEQHLALNEPPLPHHSGIINHRLSPLQILKQIAPYAQELCEVHYGSYPEYVVTGQLDTTFPYISVHMEYMLMELLKNAFRATVEFSDRTGREAHPPVEVIITHGFNNVRLRLVAEWKMSQFGFEIAVVAFDRSASKRCGTTHTRRSKRRKTTVDISLPAFCRRHPRLALKRVLEAQWLVSATDCQ